MCTVARVQVEAYKKCVLCALVEHGELPRMPRYTSLPLSRHVKAGITAYSEFADAFGTRKASELRASLEKHSAAFVKDSNLGLAKQCVQAGFAGGEPAS